MQVCFVISLIIINLLQVTLDPITVKIPLKRVNQCRKEKNGRKRQRKWVKDPKVIREKFTKERRQNQCKIFEEMRSKNDSSVKLVPPPMKRYMS